MSLSPSRTFFGTLFRAVGQKFGKAAAEMTTGIPKFVSTPGASGGVFDAFNLAVRDFPEKGQRLVTVSRPEGTFPEIFSALQVYPDRQRKGVQASSRLMDGPFCDPIIPGPWSFTLYFNSGEVGREKLTQYLSRKEQEPADPFLVAMAEDAFQAQTGESLFDWKGETYWIRTAEAVTGRKEGGTPVMICGLFSNNSGILIVNPHNDGIVNDRFVVAGSPVRKSSRAG